MVVPLFICYMEMGHLKRTGSVRIWYGRPKKNGIIMQ